jgi:signal peptidase I
VARRGRHRAEKKVSLLRELPILGFLALLLALLIKTFLAQAFFIPSGSMENTLQVEDRVIVDKLSPKLGKRVQRGQIVVFRDPGNWLGDQPVKRSKNAVVRTVKKGLVYVGLLPSDGEKDLIKRVIGLPGDKIACCDRNRRVTVNGIPVDEPYVFPGNPPSAVPFSVTVPKERLWVMGDHRSASADSRAHMTDPGQGTVPIDNVIGPAFVVLWPAERIELLKVPTVLRSPRVPKSVTAAAPAAAGLVAVLPLGVLLRLRRTRRRRVGHHG